MILAGEIGPSDAEGATAPETLRQKGPRGAGTLERGRSRQACPPKGVTRHFRNLFREALRKSLRLRDRGGACDVGGSRRRLPRDTESDEDAMAESGATLLKTPLHARHLAAGARMVPFAGYDMPVQYPHRHPERASMDPREGGSVRRVAYGPGLAHRPRSRDDGEGAGGTRPRRHAQSRARPAALYPAPHRGRRHHRRSDGGAPRRSRP